ncbi:MAG: diguanylate cyclase [Bacilli bacterium]
MDKHDLLTEIEKVKINPSYITILCSKINTLDVNLAKAHYEFLVAYLNTEIIEEAYPWVVHHLGWVHYDMGEVTVAITYQEQAHTIFEQQKNIEGLLSTIAALIGCHSFIMNYATSCEYGIKGIPLAESTGKYERLHSIKSNLALTYLEMEEYEQAKYLLDQLHTLPNIGKNANVVANLLNLSECERHLGNVEQAIIYCNQAYDLAVEWFPDIITSIYDHRARAFAALGDYETADKQFKCSIESVTERAHELYVGDAYYQWAELDILQNRYAEALVKLNKIEIENNKLHSRRTLKQVYYALYIVNKELGNQSEAFRNLELHAQLVQELEKNRKEVKRIERNEIGNEENKTYKLLYNQSQGLYRTGQRITSTLNEEDIYQIVAEEMEALFQSDSLQIYTYDDQTQTYNCKHCFERGRTVTLEPTSIHEETFAGYCITNKKDILINNLVSEFHKYFTNYDHYISMVLGEQLPSSDPISQSFIFVPILYKEEVLGVLSIQCYKADSFSIKDVVNLKILSTYLAIALVNARLYQELEYRATFDALTDVYNRKEALLRIQKELETHPQRTLIMIDIDNFKNINDTYGHLQGDEVIERIAKCIKHQIGKNNIVGRYGGEEFIVLIDSTVNDSYLLAEKLRKKIHALAFETQMNKELIVSVSIGMTENLNKNRTLHALIGEADSALYAAKLAGKNKVVSYRES